MLIQKFQYDYKKLTAIVYDNYQGNFLWLGFSSNTGICKLLKVSANNPKQVYYELDVQAEEILKIVNHNQYIYLLLKDSTYVSARIHKTTPLTFFSLIFKPIGLPETPIDIFSDLQYTFFLLPGEDGNNAKIYRTHPDPLVLTLMITLTGVHNVTSMAKKNYLDNLWVVSNEQPGKLIRIYDSAGFKFQIINLS